jgi:hypothetical protein
MRWNMVYALVLSVWFAAATGAQQNVTGVHGDVVVDGDQQLPDLGVLLRAKTRTSVGARLGSSGRFVVFDAANAELLRVQSDGKVGIGTLAPQAMLHLARTNTAGIGPEILLENKGGTNADASAVTFSSIGAPRLQLWSGIGNSAGGTFEIRQLYPPRPANDPKVLFRISDSGEVRINGSSIPLQIAAPPSNGLPAVVEFKDMTSATGVPHGVRMEMPGNSDILVSGLRLGLWSQPVIGTVDGGEVFVQSRLNVRNLAGHADLAVTSGNDPGLHHTPMFSLKRLDGLDQPIGSFGFLLDSDGKLKLLHSATDVSRSNPTPLLTIDPGTSTTPPQLSFQGAIVGAVFQDLAEWVPATSDVPPGTVVVLNPDRNNEVMASDREYDERVAGVVSAQPGLILGPAGDGKEMIATTGRVRVKVDAGRPIRVGDLLVSSDKPGMAMKSEPIDVGGVRIHRPGTIIGKALEPLASGQGEILVLLSLQ